MSKVYVTTAIPYVNAAPHLGHAVDYLNADVFARYHQMLGDEVRFQAGTDEHGNKIYHKAKELDRDTQDYVDEYAAKFQDFIHELGVDYSDFIRTSDEAHVRRVQKIWERLLPHIYSSSYEGWYCEGCERFVTQKEYDENGGSCPDHQKPYEKVSEDNYYLRLSDFKDEIKKKIESGEMQILPDFRKKEALKLLADSPDVSISRPASTLPWGVPVPADPTQTMYVWLDALSNYITVLGYPEKDIDAYWPAEVQIVGKDILRFHAIIWPAILLGLGLPLPRTILSHGFVTVGGQKMSKSLGNSVDPFEAISRHGLPAFRYFFLRHVDTFDDSDFTWEKFDEAYNGELANDYGNLVQRLSGLAAKNNISAVEFTPKEDKKYTELMDSFHYSRAMDYIWSRFQDLNRKIDETKPWSLAKSDDKAPLNSLMTELITDLLDANHLLRPFLPDTAETVEKIFTASPITPPETPLFPKN